MTDNPTSPGTETLGADADTDATCCPVAEQSTCCDPGEKAGCCGSEATARGGCGCR